MKKRFSIIISVILAMVMCFAMIACDGNPGEQKPVDFTEEAAYASLTKLGESEGLKGKITYTAGTKANKDETFTASFDLRGTTGMIAYDADNDASTPDNEYIYDLEKGVAYEKTANGYKVSTQMIPQGILDYLAKLEVDVTVPDTGDTAGDAQFDPKTLFTANAEDRTLTAAQDGKAIVNGLVTALNTAYTEEVTIKDFLDDYLSAINKDLTVESLLTSVIEGINASSTMPLNMMLSTLDSALGLTGTEDSLSATVNALLDEEVKNGNLTAEQKQDILKRTVGEMLQGLIDYLTVDMTTDPMNTVMRIIATVTDGTATEKAELLASITNYVLVKEVDVTQLPNELEAVKASIIGLVSETTFKDLIDMIPTDIPALATVKTVITDGVTFTALDTELVITFDTQMNVKSIAYSNNMSHSYTQKTTLPLLSDNDYHQSFTLDIEQIMTTVTPITVENVAVDSVPEIVMFVACGATTEDIKVYFECGDAKIADVEAYVCYTTPESDMPTTIMDTSLVTYDADTKYFTIKKSVFTKITAADVDSLSVMVQYKVDNETKIVVLSGVYVADYTPEALGATVGKYVGLITGGNSKEPDGPVA